jgi:LL-diaminopimelate aminotransferase
MEPSRRLKDQLASADGEIERRIAERRAAGLDVINLTHVDPDLPPPATVVERLCKAATEPSPVRGAGGVPELRSAVARWYQSRFKTSVDPNREVLPVPSVEEGVFGLAQALLNPGDEALVPDPGRPVYRLALSTAGAKAVDLPLRPEQDYLPELKAIPHEQAEAVRVLFLDYPAVPTGAVAPAAFLHQVVQFATEHAMLVVNLANFSEFTYDGYRSISLLEIPGSRQVCVELHSPAETLHLAGWPVAVAVGSADALRLLRQWRQAVGALSFVAAQLMVAEALPAVPAEWFSQRNATYQSRRDRAVAVLDRLGMHVRRPKAVPAVWAATPPGYGSWEVVNELLQQAGVLVAPGSWFGGRGEGYIRLSLCADDRVFEEAMHRLEGASLPLRTMAPPAEEGDESPVEEPSLAQREE